MPAAYFTIQPNIRNRIAYIMINYFYPNEYVSSVYKINYEALWQSGIRGLIFDIDNTLATYDIENPSKEVLKLIRSLSAKGFKICLLSNNNKNRVVLFNKPLGCKFVFKAKKPSIKGVKLALKYLNLSTCQVALIGDQVFTDCLAGNRANVYTILTKPISKIDEWQVRLKRIPEKVILKLYLKSRK